MAGGATEIRVLVIDDDADLRAALTDYISRMGAKVRTAGNVADAQQLLQSETNPFDLVLTDLKIPGGSGMDVLRAAHSRSLETLVAIITGYASMETAIEAIRLGAYNYITKPFSLNEIGVHVRNMIERITLSKENARLSIRIQELYQQVNRVQNERADVTRLYEDVSRQLQENGRKIDQLLSLCSGKSTKALASGTQSEKSAASTLFQAIERLDRLKESNGISHVELEEKKRDLIAEFVAGPKIPN